MVELAIGPCGDRVRPAPQVVVGDPVLVVLLPPDLPPGPDVDRLMVGAAGRREVGCAGRAALRDEVAGRVVAALLGVRSAVLPEAGFRARMETADPGCRFGPGRRGGIGSRARAIGKTGEPGGAETPADRERAISV